MAGMTLLCRNATTFKPSGELDEDAFRQFLQRFVDTKLGVYLGSAGSGEGNALTMAELKRVYEIGVEVCKGKVQVNSNQPEQHTARDSLAHAQIAARAGIDVINIYGPAGYHGYRATDEEYLAYFDRILSELKHSVALCPNQTVGYIPTPAVLAAIVQKHSQVVAINLSGVVGDAYFISLRDALKRKVEIYVAYPGSLNTLALGATGLLGAEANIIPKTFRRYIDAYEGKKANELSLAYTELRRFTQYVAGWKSSTPRWIKMSMKIFKIPGGEGGLREPYMMYSPADMQRYTDGLLRLNIREIDDMARAVGMTVPSR